ncbi:LysR substrate-binding domain-containing protein [Thioclava sp. GXIMD4216]|uniref:LysR substrate-binding domain-containing protein n=1 Tax=Thioclava sp. GXIMD4216 TaxID=3131929 RepID=UPI0030D1FDD3
MIPPRLTADGLAGLLRLAAQAGVQAGKQSAQFGTLLQELGKSTAAAQTGSGTQSPSQPSTDPATATATAAKLAGSAAAATSGSNSATSQTATQPAPPPVTPQMPSQALPNAQTAAQTSTAQAASQNAAALPARMMTDSLQPALIQAALLATRNATTSAAERRAQDRLPLSSQLGYVSQERPFLGELGLPLNTVKQVYGRDSEFIRPLTGDPLFDEPEAQPKLPLWIGAIPSFAGWLLPELLRGLHEVSPRLLRGDQGRLLHALDEGRIEVALVHEANLPDTLAQIPLVPFQPWVLLPQTHPLATQDSLKPQDLEGEAMIGLSLPPARDLFPNILRAEGVEPRLVEEYPDDIQILTAVAQEKGFSLRAASPLSPPDLAGHKIVARRLELRAGAVDQAILVYPLASGHSVAAEHFIQRAKALAEAR